MSNYINKKSLKSFYDRVLSAGLATQENLLGEVTEDFTRLLESVKHDHKSVAYDLGYGFGKYSISAAKKGFHVIAVDFVSSKYFESRLKGQSYADKIQVINKDLAFFKPNTECSLVVAKDVLHYLSKDSVKELLVNLEALTLQGGGHYLVVFTDIERYSSEGKQLSIEDEARFESKEFVELIKEIYADWILDVKVDKYREKDRTGKTDYFISNRVSVIARKESE